MNAEHVEQLKARLRERPDEYDQDVFGHGCGTACCIAGHAYVLKSDGAEYGRRSNKPTVSSVRIVDAAIKYLDVDIEDAVILFGADEGWPMEFRFPADAWSELKVEKACAFLDWLMAGNKAKDGLTEHYNPWWFQTHPTLSVSNLEWMTELWKERHGRFR